MIGLSIAVLAPATISLGNNTPSNEDGANGNPERAESIDRESLERDLKRRFSTIQEQLETIGYEYGDCKPGLRKDIKAAQESLSELESTVLKRLYADR
jgi:hypothetical protein